jgi:hypothetical protein
MPLPLWNFALLFFNENSNIKKHSIPWHNTHVKPLDARYKSLNSKTVAAPGETPAAASASIII